MLSFPVCTFMWWLLQHFSPWEKRKSLKELERLPGELPLISPREVIPLAMISKISDTSCIRSVIHLQHILQLCWEMASHNLKMYDFTKWYPYCHKFSCSFQNLRSWTWINLDSIKIFAVIKKVSEIWFWNSCNGKCQYNFVIFEEGERAQLWNYGMAGVGRDLWRPSDPTSLLKQAHLQPVSQDLVQEDFVEYYRKIRVSLRMETP